MSLILEALRKSEAERRRAQVPDLLTQSQVAVPVAVRAPQRWPLMVGGAILIVAVAWFSMTRDAPTSSDVVATVPADSAIVETPDIVATESALPAPARPAPALQKPLVVAPPVVAPKKLVAKAETNDLPSRLAPLPAPAHTATMPTSAPANDRFERITDLGPEDRKQLPPLKLSMHMWNDVAAQRFVIIDGARLGVGDHLGAIVVADIVPDGVVLDWNGRAFKLPLR
jgi:general secretion pathway protein B